MAAEDALFHILEEQLKDDSLCLPSLPEVAIRIRNTVDNEDSTLMDVAAEVARDPGLTLRIIRIANTAHYARAAHISNLNAAVHRIGMRSIRNVAIAMALEQLFICSNDIVKEYMSRAWRDAVRVSCASAAVLLCSDKAKKSRIAADAVTLMGLIHNIGLLPILHEAQVHDDVFANPTFLDSVYDQFGLRIGSEILRHWEFEPEFVEAMNHWQDLDHHSKQIELSDFIRLGAVFAGIFSDGDRQIVFASAVAKGLIEDDKIFESAEFSTRYHELLAAFE